jgi:hypothetical protein
MKIFTHEVDNHLSFRIHSFGLITAYLPIELLQRLSSFTYGDFGRVHLSQAGDLRNSKLVKVWDSPLTGQNDT